MMPQTGEIVAMKYHYPKENNDEVIFVNWLRVRKFLSNIGYHYCLYNSSNFVP